MKNSLIVSIMLSVLAVHAQNGTELVHAFSKSYSLEADKKFDEAIDALNAVYQADSYELNLRIGWLYYNTGDHFKSKSYYQKAMQLMPYAIEAKFGFILPESALGNWTSVEQTYKEILRIDTHNTKAHYWIGALYYERKAYEKAYKHIEQVVNLYPFDYDSVVLFAWINLRMGNTGKAKVLFQKALLILPGSESAQEGLGLLE